MSDLKRDRRHRSYNKEENKLTRPEKNVEIVNPAKTQRHSIAIKKKLKESERPGIWKGTENWNSDTAMKALTSTDEHNVLKKGGKGSGQVEQDQWDQNLGRAERSMGLPVSPCENV